MLARPISDNPDLAKVWKLCRKFNEVLDEALKVEQYMHILTVRDMEESNYFDINGNLTPTGQRQYWRNINHQMKEFDHNKIDLRPLVFRKDNNSHKDSRKPAVPNEPRSPTTTSMPTKLPTPPPRKQRNRINTPPRRIRHHDHGRDRKRHHHHKDRHSRHSGGSSHHY